MTMKQKLLTGAVVCAFALGGAAHAGSMNKADEQASGPAANAHASAQNEKSFEYSLVKLSGEQKQALYKAASDFDAQDVPQAVPGKPIVAGDEVPDGFSLQPIPDDVKQVQGADLEDFRIAKVEGGNVIVVDPTTKTVQAVITQQAAQQASGSTVGQGSRQSGPDKMQDKTQQ